MSDKKKNSYDTWNLEYKFFFGILNIRFPQASGVPNVFPT